MKQILIDKEIKYTGSELAPHWIYKNFNIQGDAIACFQGECEVKLSEMVDIQDVLEDSPIYSKKMLHFIVEHFNIELIEGVLRQRMLIVIIKECIEKNYPHIKIIREGDDLFFEGKKLSVSIATKSATSVLIHTGININPAGAPVKAAGLCNDMNISDVNALAKNILEDYTKELDEVVLASCKVRGV